MGNPNRSGVFQLGTILDPHKYQMGMDGKEPLYADCARCGKKDAVMHGMIIGNDGLIAVTTNTQTHESRRSLFCETCWPIMLELNGVPSDIFTEPLLKKKS